MPIIPTELYTGEIARHKDSLRSLQRRLALVAALRLVFFTALAIAIYYIFRAPSALRIVLAVVAMSGFAVLVGIYFRLKDKKQLADKLLFVCANELELLNNGLNGFPDGRERLDSTTYLDDLDIFGLRSLFHVLNRTTTSYGSERLSAMLKQPMLEKEAILRQQAAVRALVPQGGLRRLLTAKGLLVGPNDGPSASEPIARQARELRSLEGWLSSPARLVGRKWLLALRWVLVAYNLAAILWYLSTDNYLPLVGGIAAAWAFIGRFARYISEQHILISKKQATLGQYADILAVFNTMDCHDSYLLRDWQARTEKAHKAIRGLSRLSSFFDQRMNMLVNIFLNSFLVYDLQCMIALEKWKEANREGFPDWIAVVGDIECLNSLASFAFNHPDYAYPAPADGSDGSDGSDGNGLFIDAKGMAHPLIPAAESVANDISIGRDQRLVLVTGSNMSGKTTFLRTTGVNLLLAQCGAPVCAAAFHFTPMQLLTSLRVSDSLQEHTSYFMAELKKLQRIVHSLQSGRPALVLIDEILRGTNSEDKTYGSEQFIRKLLHYHCLALFATHDLSLGSLEQELPDRVSNYCFESVIEQGQLHFNYQLQRGVARNRNASFLMQKMEII